MLGCSLGRLASVLVARASGLRALPLHMLSELGFSVHHHHNSG